MRVWNSETILGMDVAKELFDYAPAALCESRRNNVLKPFRIQREGALALHNILCRQKYAYLADEVGMGKTLVALGTVALLLARKPNARVVVVVPKHGVANQWARDWNEFTRLILKTDHPGLRDPILHRPVREVHECLRAEGVYEAILRSDAVLPVISIYAFRFLRQSLKKEPESGEMRFLSLAKQRMRRQSRPDSIEQHFLEESLPELNDHLRDLLGTSKIDLLVVDEAQCLRHPHNLTNTTLAGIFGLQSSHVREREIFDVWPLVDRMLFVSATPMHRQKDDLYQQLSYIVNESMEKTRKIELQDFMIRRFRRFAGYTKFHYRGENPVEARPESVGEHLFMAMSQKLLEATLHGAAQGGRKRFELGFMETFESFGKDFELAEQLSEGTDGQEAGESWGDGEPKREQGALTAGPEERIGDSVTRQPPDRAVLESLASTWAEAMMGVSYPAHPKYKKVKEFVLQQLRENDDAEKFLIFVRRIKGTREIAGAALAAYREYLWDQVRRIHGGELPQSLSRRAPEDPDQGKSGYAGMDPINLFISKKFGDANLLGWREKLVQPNSLEFGPFFHESPLRAFMAWNGFSREDLLARVGESSLEIRFLEAARKYTVTKNTERRWLDFLIWEKTFIETWGDEPGAKILLRLLEFMLEPYMSRKDGEPALRLPGEFFKLLVGKRSFWEWLVEDKDLKEKGLNGILKSGDESRLWTWELQKKWAKVVLLSGEGLPLLFAASGGSYSTPPKVEMLRSIVGNTGNWINLTSRVLWRVLQFLDDDIFRQVKRQILDRDHRSQDDFHILRNASVPPALRWQLYSRAVSGDAGRDGILSAQRQFNSPGFPDILVTTDVMREGLDLHIFCRSLLHYGIAWSAGDLEQRIGRCDRVFSRTFRILTTGSCESADNVLHIGYPVMMGSIDERQVAKIIEDKLQINSLIDSQGKSGGLDPEQRRYDLKNAFEKNRRFSEEKKNLDSPLNPRAEDILETTSKDARVDSLKGPFFNQEQMRGIRERMLDRLITLFSEVSSERNHSVSSPEKNVAISRIDSSEIRNRMEWIKAQPGPLQSYLGHGEVQIVNEGELRYQRVRFNLDVYCDVRDCFVSLNLQSPVGTPSGKKPVALEEYEGVSDMAHREFPGAKLCHKVALDNPWYAQKALLVSRIPRFSGFDGNDGPTFSLEEGELLAAISHVAGLADSIEKIVYGTDMKEEIKDERTP